MPSPAALSESGTARLTPHFSTTTSVATWRDFFRARPDIATRQQLFYKYYRVRLSIAAAMTGSPRVPNFAALQTADCSA